MCATALCLANWWFSVASVSLANRNCKQWMGDNGCVDTSNDNLFVRYFTWGSVFFCRTHFPQTFSRCHRISSKIRAENVTHAYPSHNYENDKAIFMDKSCGCKINSLKWVCVCGKIYFSYEHKLGNKVGSSRLDAALARWKMNWLKMDEFFW